MTEPLLPQWPHTALPPLTAAELRAQPEDFVVEERVPFALTGEGEHLWVQVRKRGFNTDQVARLLARLAGLSRRDVGYAGMKDRHAVTVQWFSLHLPGKPDPEWHDLPPDVSVTASARHNRKLKTGALAGNGFDIVLRNCAGDRDAVLKRVASIAAHGVPNYFGEQRFGRGGENLARARAMFAGEHVRDRHLAGIYLSAARAFLFNEILAERVRTGVWDKLLAGEACSLAGSRSFFQIEEPDDTLVARLAVHDIHPSGALWGAGELPTRLAARELEEAVVQRHVDFARGLEAADLRQERRALRLIPQELSAEWIAPDALRLCFSLSAGCFATALLREIAVYRDVATHPMAE